MEPSAPEAEAAAEEAAEAAEETPLGCQLGYWRKYLRGQRTYDPAAEAAEEAAPAAEETPLAITEVALRISASVRIRSGRDVTHEATGPCRKVKFCALASCTRDLHDMH
jgi:hypothetical protein